LDVEGAELSILNTIDFSFTTFDIFLIEVSEQKTDQSKKIRQLLNSHGYEFYKTFDLDNIFCRKDFCPLN